MNKVAFVVLLPLLLMASFVTWATDNSLELRDVEVVGISDLPAFGSGYEITWVSVDFKGRDGKGERVYMVYFGDEQRIPVLGDRCDVRYEVGTVRGNVGSQWKSIDAAMKAQMLDCRYHIDATR